MAEWFLKRLDPSLEIYSAGTRPASRVHPHAVTAMAELGIDMSHAHPKSVDRFLGETFDYVITVCDHADETCPTFAGRVRHRLHMGFDDPTEAEGSYDHKMSEFRRIRDEICLRFRTFHNQSIQPMMKDHRRGRKT